MQNEASYQISLIKETKLERADFTLQLLMFVTAEKERHLFISFFLSIFCQLLSPRFKARIGRARPGRESSDQPAQKSALSNLVSLGPASYLFSLKRLNQKELTSRPVDQFEIIYLSLCVFNVSPWLETQVWDKATPSGRLVRAFMVWSRSAYPSLKSLGEQLAKTGKKENYKYSSLLFCGYKQ